MTRRWPPWVWLAFIACTSSGGLTFNGGVADTQKDGGIADIGAGIVALIQDPDAPTVCEDLSGRLGQTYRTVLSFQLYAPSGVSSGVGTYPACLGAACPRPAAIAQLIIDGGLLAESNDAGVVTVGFANSRWGGSYDVELEELPVGTGDGGRLHLTGTFNVPACAP